MSLTVVLLNYTSGGIYFTVLVFLKPDHVLSLSNRAGSARQSLTVVFISSLSNISCKSINIYSQEITKSHKHFMSWVKTTSYCFKEVC